MKLNNGVIYKQQANIKILKVESFSVFVADKHRKYPYSLKMTVGQAINQSYT